MEYVSGSELEVELMKERVFSHKKLVSLMKTLFELLVYLEYNNVVHRDLKPSNIMIALGYAEYGSRVKLIDFGLSTYVTTQEANSYMCGTPGYIAPENFNSQQSLKSSPYGKSDIFSLGITVYKVIYDNLPFKANNRANLLQLNKKCSISFPKTEFNKYPYLSNLLPNLVSVDPGKRLTPQDALLHPFFTANYIDDSIKRLVNNQLPLIDQNMHKNRHMARQRTTDKTKVVRNDTLLEAITRVPRYPNH